MSSTTDSTVAYLLPLNIETLLALLHKYYGKDRNTLLQRIVVNSASRIHEEWSYDNWDGGITGHALYLDIAESLFLECVTEKDSIQNRIKDDINKLHSYANEFVAQVFLQSNTAARPDWRKESGLLAANERLILPDAEERIWEIGTFRLFISHKAEDKKLAGDLRDRLMPFGISCFVAHEDILPTREWQTEIENALATMDGFVALLTEEFHDSEWTDQEVGYALAKDIPMIALRLGRDPYGFIGKFQALTCGWDIVDIQLLKLLINYDKAMDAFINAMGECDSWSMANKLAIVLPSINTINDQQITNIMNAFNNNLDIYQSFGFNGQVPRSYGVGLPHHLAGC